MTTILKIVLAIFLPPVAAFLQVGIGLHFWLNILLTIFFWVPGQVHAIWLIVTKHQPQVS
ncbi:MAG: YqaE/Pmp3 family membrane protein [Phycisphaerales bacterium]